MVLRQSEYFYLEIDTDTKGLPWWLSRKESACNAGAKGGTRFWFPGQEDPLEDGRTKHSSTVAWRIPWTEEPGRLQSMGSQRVRPDWRDLALRQAHINTMKRQPVRKAQGDMKERRSHEDKNEEVEQILSPLVEIIPKPSKSQEQH